MASPPGTARQIVLTLAATALTLGSAFFAFYTVRLLVVTRGLRAVRAGGHGAYIGAVAFPVLAVLLGWGAWRIAAVIRGRRPSSDA
jgi:hypothetical protein